LIVGRRKCCDDGATVKGKEILEEIVKMLLTMLDKLGCRTAKEPTIYEDKEAEVEKD
jgi:hypothetical protein